MSYKLFFDDVFLGEITWEGIDDFWQIGSIAPTESLNIYRCFFDYLTDESEQLQPPKNFEDLFFGDHWFVEDDLGTKRQIDAPAVYEDNEIRWQWIQGESR